MIRGIHGWSPELERSFKELLFRFLEEVQATKAALYLFGEGTYLLATQYGFHRHDLVATEHHASDPLARSVRANPREPQVFNQIEELHDAATYLQGANTSRLLLVPLQIGSRVVGFADLRDKGRKRPFEPGDVARCKEIAAAIIRLIRQAALYPNLEEEITETPVSQIQQPIIPERPEGPTSMIDELALAEVVEVAGELAAALDIAGVALSVVLSRKAGMILLGSGAPQGDQEALIRHQLETLRMAGMSGPELPAWKVEQRHVTTNTEIARAQHVASAVLLLSRGWALVGSVLAISAAPARTPLATLQRSAERIHIETGLRWARRSFARRLIQPGDNSYPELVKHSLAVSQLCWSIAAALGGSAADREEAAIAGLLHDVGMYELDYRKVYRHPSPGTTEKRLYQQHVISGAKTVTEIGSDKIARAIRHHHERWDGKGYPDRLVKDAIPPLARLIHVAETFDTLTASYSYLAPIPPAKALSIIRAGAGAQFDPDVVEALAGVHG